MRCIHGLRLVCVVVLLAVSLLAVVPAPTTLLWKVAIGVTEWGHVLAVCILLVCLPGWSRAGRLGHTTALVGLVAAGVALSPVMRGYWFARQHGMPLSLRTLLVGHRAPHVRTDPVAYAYTADDGSRLGIDVYRGDRPTPAPCVVVIHGGSWSGGGRRDLATLNARLAARGVVVAAIDYRLAPAHPFPAALHDVQAALRFLKTHAARFGIDSTWFVLLGRSAGGQLALLTAYAAHDPAIRGVVGLYAPTDLRFGYAHPSNPHVIDSRGTLRVYLGGPPTLVGAQYDAASPVFAVSSTAVPTILIHGARDELVSVRHSDRLAAALHAAGRPYRYFRLPWATHGCDFNPDGPCGQVIEAALHAILADTAVSSRDHQAHDTTGELL